MEHLNNLTVVRFVLFALLALSCREKPAVPLDTQLWKIEGPWRAAAESIRVAPATIIVFRSSGEFVSLQCTLIERPDETVYILSRAPKAAKVGKWRTEGGEVIANVDCKDARYRVIGRSVRGEAGVYSPVTRFVAPAFESYVKAATPCVQK